MVFINMIGKCGLSDSSAVDQSVLGQAPRLSIIIPTWNEEGVIASTLAELDMLKNQAVEIIVVDGGSSDRTVEIAKGIADRVLIKPTGRAIQMNHGANMARGEYLLFLHADTRMPSNSFEILKKYFEQNCIWGRFDLRLSGRNRLFRIVEFCINLRSRLSGVATGDQAMFVNRAIFHDLGGFPEIAIMEDIALSKKLIELSPPVCLREKVITSSRRWEQHGIGRTILLMWVLRLLYFFGVSPERLARWYR